MSQSGWRPPCAPTSASVVTRPASRQPKAAPSSAKGSQQQPGSPTSTATTTTSSRLTQETSSSRLEGPASLRVDEDQANKHTVSVAVRIRPLSSREILQGEEVAWYADGDTVVRSDKNPNVGYAYDRVFAPPTTNLEVYDVAAQHVVSGAMEGIDGTIIAYGVTSSGKTHTMHGYRRSPGIIPLAVKDAFSIIHETLNHKFLLRASYLEIYDEVLNDLLNPAGQNLQIRDDHSGTFVEGIKEVVILSPAHALSLIAAGEEHRHDASTNFNLLSSRSHVIFTLTIESSSYGESNEGEAVTFSQLRLIDLAGPVSSMAETPGVRQKEVSYYDKSLLTLDMLISQLTDGKDMNISFRDSKLTLLLQSSLSGQGRVSLICTVTPASSKSQETHNALKFAQRVKRIEVQVSQNKISTKSTKTCRFSPCPRPRRRHSFAEEEMAYLPHSRRDIMSDNEINELLVSGEEFGAALGNSSKEEKKKQKGLLNWFKMQVNAVDSRVFQYQLQKKTTECLEESSNNIVMQKSSGVSHEAQQKDQEKTVPGEISVEALENKQQVSCLIDRLSRLFSNMKQQISSLEEQISQVMVDSLDLSPIKATDNRIIQDQTSESLEEHLSQALQTKDSQSNIIVMQKSYGVNLEAQQQIPAEPLSNKQQVSALIDQLLRLMGDMKQQLTSLEKQIRVLRRMRDMKQQLASLEKQAPHSCEVKV